MNKAFYVNTRKQFSRDHVGWVQANGFECDRRAKCRRKGRPKRGVMPARTSCVRRESPTGVTRDDAGALDPGIVNSPAESLSREDVTLRSGPRTTPDARLVA